MIDQNERGVHMSKFQQFWWYIGVFMTSIALLVSVSTRNWILTFVCAISAFMLQKLNDKVELPKVYRDRGIKNEWFTPRR